MDYKQVIFLESPATGKQARIILDGAQATTSTVNNIQVNPSYPGWFWIQTVSGSLYAGQLQSPDRTVFVSGGAAQHQVNNYNIQQSAEIQTSPFQSANEQRYINTAQSYRHQSQTPNWLPFLVAPAIFLFAIYVFGMQDPNLASLISYAIVIGSSIWVGIDSNSLCKRYGYPQSKVALWVIACLCIWIICFPWYLSKQGDLTAKDDASIYIAASVSALLYVFIMFAFVVR